MSTQVGKNGLGGPTRPVGAQRLAKYGAVSVSDASGEEGPGPQSWANARDAELLAEGGPPPPKFQDLPFAALFVAQLVAMICVGAVYGSWPSPPAGDGGAGAIDADDDLAQAEAEIARTVAEVGSRLPRIAAYVVVPCAVVSYALAAFGTAVLIPMFPEFAVGSCLAMSLVTTALFCLYIVLTAPGVFTAVVAVVMFGVAAWYVRRVWRLIPFAAANLAAALRGMSANWGMYVLAVFFAAVSAVWVVFWLYAADGILSDEQAAQQGSTNDGLDQTQGGAVFWGSLFLLLVSLYWTTTVILNTIQTTVAGVMGTWCFDKEAATWGCSSAVTSSLYRSLTFSFGSICLGSLLEALAKALRVLAEMAKNQARENNDSCSGVIFCILECILRIFEDVIEYFNRWAYVFVGLYGFGYVESGKKAVELFQARGWTAIITDDLVGYVLNFTAVAVAILTGLVAVWIEAGTSRGSESFLFGDVAGAGAWAFFVGLLVGLFVSAVMMNSISGAVNTVIVCFADSPAKLEENHPGLTYQMASAWVSVFPECGVRVPQKQPALATVIV